jgi:heptosyltransferase-3
MAFVRPGGDRGAKPFLLTSRAMVPDAVDLARVRRALVIKLRHHGDVLLASPVFSVLKRHAPNLEIDALVYDETHEMLALHPAIAEVHTIRRARRGRSPLAMLAAESRLLSRLRARRYDLIVHLTDHNRGAWLARLLGATWRVAPAGRDYSRLWNRSFTHLYKLPPGRRHTVEVNLDALRRIGLYPAEDERALVFVPGDEAEAEIRNRMVALGLPERGFVHLHPASRWRFKCWPVDRTAALIDRLAAAGERIVLTAAPSEPELELVRAIRSACRADTVDLSGQLTLKQLAALAGRAKLFVGVDSAPMHIAAAMRTPVVALFGPSGDIEWGPWQVPHRIVASAVHPCRPCGNDGCGGGKVSECLTTLPVDRVYAAVSELLAAARA